MPTTHRLSVVALAMVGLLVMPRSAAAQVTTGSVAGSVKDQQGVTSTDGDFVVPNVTADVYTILVEMPSFKTLRRSEVTVSATTNS